MNLFFSYNVNIESAYVINIENHEKSQKLADRCVESCKSVGMNVKKWSGYNGVRDPIIPPEHLKNDRFMSCLKITDHYLTRGEVACALSHISLWLHCATIDQPIVILEHDAVMIKAIREFEAFNSIIYLGGAEWVKDNWPVIPIPPHATEGPNYHFICRAHAYAIDPTMAKNLLSHVLMHGISAPLDIMMRTDLFNVTHRGVYAYDDNDNTTTDTTILARPASGRTTRRNDTLRW